MRLACWGTRQIPVRPDFQTASTGNWPEYGGVVLGGKAKNRNARDMEPDSVMLNSERAVIDTDLCYRVGRVRVERYREKNTTVSHVPLAAYVYPLAGLVYCAHCEREGDTAHRAPLSGCEGHRDLPRYRHADKRHPCEALNKSVKVDVIERSSPGSLRRRR